MVAFIEGFTRHSYGYIPFYVVDGPKTNVRKKSKAPDMSHLYVRYERLRWIFIDEVSTASAQVPATFEDHIRRSTRAEHTWAMRSDI